MDGRTCKGPNIMRNSKITPEKSGAECPHMAWTGCHFEKYRLQRKRHSGVGQQGLAKVED